MAREKIDIFVELHDRVSQPALMVEEKIDDIGDAADRADNKIRKLSEELDALGKHNADLESKLDGVNARLAGMNKQLGRSSGPARNHTSAISKLFNVYTRGKGIIEGYFTSLKMIQPLFTDMAAMIPIIGTGMHALSAVTVGLTGQTLKLGKSFLTAIPAMASFIQFAVIGGQAVGALVNNTIGLSKEARKFRTAMKGISKEYGSLGVLSANAMTGYKSENGDTLQKSLVGLTSRYREAIKTVTKDTGKSLARIGIHFSEVFNNDKMLDYFSVMSKETTKSGENFGKAFSNIMGGMLKIGTAAAPTLTKFTKWFEDSTASWSANIDVDKMTKDIAASGEQLAGFWEGAKALGRGLKGIFAASDDLGKWLGGGMKEGLLNWEKKINSSEGQAGLKEYFDGQKDNISAVGRFLVGVKDMVKGLGDSENFIPMMDSMTEGLPQLGNLIKKIDEYVLPPLISILDRLNQVDLDGAMQAVGIFVDMVDKLLAAAISVADGIGTTAAYVDSKLTGTPFDPDKAKLYTGGFIAAVLGSVTLNKLLGGLPAKLLAKGFPRGNKAPKGPKIPKIPTDLPDGKAPKGNWFSKFARGGKKLGKLGLVGAGAYGLWDFFSGGSPSQAASGDVGSGGNPFSAPGAGGATNAISISAGVVYVNGAVAGDGSGGPGSGGPGSGGGGIGIGIASALALFVGLRKGKPPKGIPGIPGLVPKAGPKVTIPKGLPPVPPPPSIGPKATIPKGLPPIIVPGSGIPKGGFPAGPLPPSIVPKAAIPRGVSPVPPPPHTYPKPGFNPFLPRISTLPPGMNKPPPPPPVAGKGGLWGYLTNGLRKSNGKIGALKTAGAVGKGAGGIAALMGLDWLGDNTEKYATQRRDGTKEGALKATIASLISGGSKGISLGSWASLLGPAAGLAGMTTGSLFGMGVSTLKSISPNLDAMNPAEVIDGKLNYRNRDKAQKRVTDTALAGTKITRSSWTPPGAKTVAGITTGGLALTQSLIGQDTYERAMRSKWLPQNWGKSRFQGGRRDNGGGLTDTPTKTLKFNRGYKRLANSKKTLGGVLSPWDPTASYLQPPESPATWRYPSELLKPKATPNSWRYPSELLKPKATPEKSSASSLPSAHANLKTPPFKMPDFSKFKMPDFSKFKMPDFSKILDGLRGGQKASPGGGGGGGILSMKVNGGGQVAGLVAMIKDIPKKIDIDTKVAPEGVNRIGVLSENIKSVPKSVNVDTAIAPKGMVAVKTLMAKIREVPKKIDVATPVSPLGASRVDSLAAKVRAVPKTIDIKANATTGGAQSVIDGFINRNKGKVISVVVKAAASMSGIASRLLSGFTGTKAAGGEVAAGSSHLVGERGAEGFLTKSGKFSMIGTGGPEIRNFSEPGFVIPNHMVTPAYKAQMSGGTPTIDPAVQQALMTRDSGPSFSVGNVNVTVQGNIDKDVDIERAVQRGIAAAARRQRERV